jgi:hypothetical protein
LIAVFLKGSVEDSVAGQVVFAFATESKPIKYMEQGNTDYKAVLLSDTLATTWRECEATNKTGDDSLRGSVFALRDQFLAVLDDVNDPDEQEYLTLIFYALVRCHWIIGNIQAGYRISAGKTDNALYAQSGMLSALLGQVETSLNPHDVQGLQNALSRLPSESHGESEIMYAPTPKEVGVEEAKAQLVGLQFAVNELQQERDALATQAQTLQAERQMLEKQFGTSNPQSIIAHVRNLQTRFAALQEIQQMVSNLEETVHLLNY